MSMKISCNGMRLLLELPTSSYDVLEELNPKGVSQFCGGKVSIGGNDQDGYADFV